MLSSIDRTENSNHRLVSLAFWHVWTVTIPRRSITGRYVHGRVWRRHDGLRWQYRAMTEYEDERS
jgi:hypothetical protein